MIVKKFEISRDINAGSTIRNKEYQIKEIARNIAELIYKDGSCFEIIENTDLFGNETVVMNLEVVVKKQSEGN